MFDIPSVPTDDTISWGASALIGNQTQHQFASQATLSQMTGNDCSFLESKDPTPQ